MTRKIDMEIWQDDTSPEIDIDVCNQEPIDLDVSVEESKPNNLDMTVWQDDEQIVSVSVETGYFTPGDIHYGETLTGTGTAADPVNVAPDIIEKIDSSINEITGTGTVVTSRSGNMVNIATTTLVYETEIAQTEWTIVHNLNKRPSVTIVDSAGTEGTCEVTYVDNNTCVIKTNYAFKGTAYLN